MTATTHVAVVGSRRKCTAVSSDIIYSDALAHLMMTVKYCKRIYVATHRDTDIDALPLRAEQTACVRGCFVGCAAVEGGWGELPS